MKTLKPGKRVLREIRREKREVSRLIRETRARASIEANAVVKHRLHNDLVEMERYRSALAGSMDDLVALVHEWGPPEECEYV